MSDSKIKWIGVSVAVLLHIVVALAVTSEVIFKTIFPEKKIEDVAEVQSEPKPVMSFTITPRPKEVVVIPEIPKAELPKPKPKEKQQYTTTSPEQPKGKVENAKFFGEEDTIAQSNAEADPTAEKMPSIAGKERDYLSMASRGQDGSLEHEDIGAPSSLAKPSVPNDPTESKEPDNQKPEPEVAKVEPKVSKQADAEKSLAGSNLPLIDYMESINKLPSEIKTKDPITESLLNDIGKTDLEKEKAERPKEVAKTEKLPKPKESKKPSTPSNASRKPGFRSNTEASRMIGSISRRGGVSSLDAEGTPLGKYIKSVNRSIEQEWRRRIGRNPDLIKPGTLQVRWYVYDTGRVKDIRVLNELQGSEIQKGMTIQSITSAKIPKMSESLKQDRQGEPIEIVITFQF